jgi:divalent metal cation (Fe/Co/Zn/Cd) transporter
MSAGSRTRLLKTAVALEWFTLAWMTIEGGLSIWAGVMAHSVSVTAFGLDSIVELISAGVLMWRLQGELRHALAFDDEIEHRAHKIGGALLFVLAAYVVIAAGEGLYHHRGQEFSLLGAAVSAIAVVVMYPLARAKRTAADGLSSRALRADAAESLACGYLSVAVLAGMVAQLLLRAWWIDGVVSLGIVYFLIKEGLEAYGGADCCD